MLKFGSLSNKLVIDVSWTQLVSINGGVDCALLNEGYFKLTSLILYLSILLHVLVLCSSFTVSPATILKLKFIKPKVTVYSNTTWQSEVVTPYTKKNISCRDHSKIKIKNAAVSCRNML
jgi:hypothetical protein